MLFRRHGDGVGAAALAEDRIMDDAYCRSDPPSGARSSEFAVRGVGAIGAKTTEHVPLGDRAWLDFARLVDQVALSADEVLTTMAVTDRSTDSTDCVIELWSASLGCWATHL